MMFEVCNGRAVFFEQRGKEFWAQNVRLHRLENGRRQKLIILKKPQIRPDYQTGTASSHVQNAPMFRNKIINMIICFARVGPSRFFSLLGFRKRVFLVDSVPCLVQNCTVSLYSEPPMSLVFAVCRPSLMDVMTNATKIQSMLMTIPQE